MQCRIETKAGYNELLRQFAEHTAGSEEKFTHY